MFEYCFCVVCFRFMKFLPKSSYSTRERPREQDLGEQFCPASSRAHRERCVQGLARLVVVLKVIKMVCHL